MSKEILKKIHTYIFRFILLFTEIEFILINLDCLCRDNILYVSCLAVFLLFFIKEIIRIKSNLKKENPTCIFIIEIISDICLLTNIILFIGINKCKDSEKLLSYAFYLYFILLFLRILQFTICSEDGAMLLTFIGAFIFLSVINKENQEIITIITTLIATIFGRTVLKNVFRNQIYYYEKNNKLERSDILDKLEYGLASFNIQIIFAHIIILVTEYFRSGGFYKKILEKLDLRDNILIGFIRIIIIGIVYIIFVLGIGKKIKERVFNFLMKIN